MVDKTPVPKSNVQTLTPKIAESSGGGDPFTGPFEVKSPHALVAAMIGIFIIIVIIVILNWGRISQKFKKVKQDKSLDQTKPKSDIVQVGPDGQPITSKK